MSVLKREQLDTSKNDCFEEIREADYTFFPTEVQQEIKLYTALTRGLTVIGEPISQYYRDEALKEFNVDSVNSHAKFDKVMQAYCTNILKNPDPELFARIKQYVRDNPDFDVAYIKASGDKVTQPWSIDRLGKLVQDNHIPADKTKLPTCQFYKDAGRGLTLAAQYLQPAERAILITRKYKKITDDAWRLLNSEERDSRIKDTISKIGDVRFNRVQYQLWEMLTPEEQELCFDGMTLHELYETVYKEPWEQTPDCEARLDVLLMERLGIDAPAVEHLKIQYTQNATYVAKTPLVNSLLIYPEEANIPGLKQLILMPNKKPELFYGYNLSRKDDGIHMHSTVPFQCAREPNQDTLYKVEGKVTTHSHLDPDTTFIQQEVIIRGAQPNDHNEEFITDCYKGEEKKAFHRFPLERLTFEEALVYDEFNYRDKIKALQNPRAMIQVDNNKSMSLIGFLDEVYQVYSDGYCDVLLRTKKPTENDVAKFKAKHVYVLFKNDDDGWRLLHYNNRIKLEIEIPAKLQTVIEDLRSGALSHEKKSEISNLVKQHHLSTDEAKESVQSYESEKTVLIESLQNAVKNRADLFQELSLENLEFRKDRTEDLFSGLQMLSARNSELIAPIKRKISEFKEPQTIQEAELNEILTSLYDLQIFLANCENPQTYISTDDIYTVLNQRLNTYSEKFAAAAKLVAKHQSFIQVQPIIKAEQLAQLKLIHQFKEGHLKQVASSYEDACKSYYRTYLQEEPNLFKSFHQGIVGDERKGSGGLKSVYTNLLDDEDTSDDVRIRSYKALQLLTDLELKLFEVFSPQHFAAAQNDDDIKAIFAYHLPAFRNVVMSTFQTDTVRKDPDLSNNLKVFFNFLQGDSLSLGKLAVEKKQEVLQNAQDVAVEDEDAVKLRSSLLISHEAIIVAVNKLNVIWANHNPMGYSFSKWLEKRDDLTQKLIALYQLQAKLLELKDPQNFKNVESIEEYKEIFQALVISYLKQLQELISQLKNVSRKAWDELREFEKKYPPNSRANVEFFDDYHAELTSQAANYDAIVLEVEDHVKRIVEYTNPFEAKVENLKEEIRRYEKALEANWGTNRKEFKDFYERPLDPSGQNSVELISTEYGTFVKKLRDRSKELIKKLQQDANEFGVHAADKTHIYSLMVKLLTIRQQHQIAFKNQDNFPSNKLLEESFLSLLEKYKAELKVVLASEELKALSKAQRLATITHLNETINLADEMKRDRAKKSIVILKDNLLKDKDTKWQIVQQELAPIDGVDPVPNVAEGENVPLVVSAPQPEAEVSKKLLLRDLYEVNPNLFVRQPEIIPNCTPNDLRDWKVTGNSDLSSSAGNILFASDKATGSWTAYLVKNDKPELEIVPIPPESPLVRILNKKTLKDQDIKQLRLKLQANPLFKSRFPREALKMVDELWATGDHLLDELNRQYTEVYQQNPAAQLIIIEQQRQVLQFQEKLLDFYNIMDVNLSGFYKLYYQNLDGLRNLQTQLSAQQVEKQDLRKCNTIIQKVLQKGSVSKEHYEQYFENPELKYVVARCLGVPNASDPGTRFKSLRNIFDRHLGSKQVEYAAIKNLSIEEISARAQLYDTDLQIRKVRNSVSSYLANFLAQQQPYDALSFSDALLQVKRRIEKLPGAGGSLWDPRNWFGQRNINRNLFAQYNQLHSRFCQEFIAVEEKRSAEDKGYYDQLNVEITQLYDMQGQDKIGLLKTAEKAVAKEFQSVVSISPAKNLLIANTLANDKTVMGRGNWRLDRELPVEVQTCLLRAGKR